MKTLHPEIAERRFSTPQGSEQAFEQFLASSDEPRAELLAELSSGIAAEHGRAIPISTCSTEPAFLLELPRFIVVYQLLPGAFEVATILAKRNPAGLDQRIYFTSTVTLPAES